jgi:HK97 family phage major capsid protein
MQTLDILRENLALKERELELAEAEAAGIAKAMSVSGRHRPTPDQEKRFGAATTTVDQLHDQIDEIRARQVELTEILDRQATSHRKAPVPNTRTAGTSEVRGQALRHVDAQTYVADGLRSAAVRAIESDPSDAVAGYAAATADPSYLSAWFKLAKDPQRGHLVWTPAEHEAFGRVAAVQAHADRELRAISDGTNNAGGYAVPFMLDPAWTVTGAGSISSIRDIATIKTVATSAYHGITAGQVTAAWTAEASAAPDNTPTFTQPNIPNFMGEAFVAVSFQAWDDISGVVNEVQRLFGDAKANLEATAFLSGNGTTAPKGIDTAVGAVTASRVSPVTGGTFTIADVYSVQNALPARHSARASWLASLTILNRIRRFGEGTTGSNSAFWSDLGGNVPAELLGRPIREFSTASASVTTGQDILYYGDFSKYVIADHVSGTRTELIPNMLDTSTGRPTAQRGILLWWRTGADMVDADAARVLRL